ncbi:MAG: Ketosteroid isomerase-like protein [Bryobacterales bacterium]|nr:Ketosteroid isomerase-like protein [Bryobacterales bacterium]
MFLAGCGQFNVQTGSNREADERAIRDLDAEWAKAAAEKNVDQVMTSYADDASMFVPNEPIAMGKPAIRVEWTKMTSNPGYALSFSPSRVDVAKAGDMAYEFGVYSLMLTGPDGKPINDRGKYVVVWKKQPDGKWKVVADIINSDLPMTSPAAAPSAPA